MCGTGIHMHIRIALLTEKRACACSAVAWKDFCDDLDNSKTYDNTAGLSEALAASRGAQMSFETLSPANPLQSTAVRW